MEKGAPGGAPFGWFLVLGRIRWPELFRWGYVTDLEGSMANAFIIKSIFLSFSGGGPIVGASEFTGAYSKVHDKGISAKLHGAP